MEDIKSNINKWKDSHVHRSGNNIVKMAIVLHIQHNAYQKYSLFFCRNLQIASRNSCGNKIEVKYPKQISKRKQ